MRIRNDHPVTRLVPARHELVAPGQEIEWPDHLTPPDGFAVTEAAPAPPAEPTKAQLLELAAELGIQVNPKDKKAVIQAAIDAAAEPDETLDPQE